MSSPRCVFGSPPAATTALSTVVLLPLHCCPPTVSSMQRLTLPSDELIPAPASIIMYTQFRPRIRCKFWLSLCIYTLCIYILYYVCTYSPELLLIVCDPVCSPPSALNTRPTLGCYRNPPFSAQNHHFQYKFHHFQYKFHHFQYKIHHFQYKIHRFSPRTG